MRSTITVNGFTHDVRKVGRNFFIDVAGEAGAYKIVVFPSDRHEYWCASIRKYSPHAPAKLIRHVTTSRGLTRRKTAAQMARVALIDFARV